MSSGFSSHLVLIFFFFSSSSFLPPPLNGGGERKEIVLLFSYRTRFLLFLRQPHMKEARQKQTESTRLAVVYCVTCLAVSIMQARTFRQNRWWERCVCVLVCVRLYNESDLASSKVVRRKKAALYK
jgi:hypothetical protein